MITITKDDGSLEVTFTGCVVSIDTESVQVMSDIWERHTSALVYDNEKGTFTHRFLYSDYGSDRKSSATVDATDEVRALYEAHKAVEAAKKTLERAEAARERALQDVRTPARGKIVKVVKGRKIPKGTVGECTWYGEGRSYQPFRSSYRDRMSGPMRVGMKVDGKIVYTDAKNVEVVV
jgi:hypothetical protein